MEQRIWLTWLRLAEARALFAAHGGGRAIVYTWHYRYGVWDTIKVPAQGDDRPPLVLEGRPR